MEAGLEEEEASLEKKGFLQCLYNDDVPPASGIQIYYEGLKATSSEVSAESRGTKGSRPHRGGRGPVVQMCGTRAFC